MLLLGPLGASWAAFWAHLGCILGCFFGSRAGKQDFLKTFKPIEKTKFFEVQGGRKSDKNGSGNCIQQEPGRKSVWGSSWGRFWSHLRVTLGPKIGPKRGPKTSWILGRFLRGSWGRRGAAAGAPLGSRRTPGRGRGG